MAQIKVAIAFNMPQNSSKFHYQSEPSAQIILKELNPQNQQKDSQGNKKRKFIKKPTYSSSTNKIEKDNITKCHSAMGQQEIESQDFTRNSTSQPSFEHFSISKLMIEEQVPPPPEDHSNMPFLSTPLPPQKVDPKDRVRIFGQLYYLCDQLETNRFILAHASQLLAQVLELLPKEKDLKAKMVACLVIALRIEYTNFMPRAPNLSKEDMEKVFEIQKKIYSLLNFKLHRNTYVTHLEDIFNAWDKFIKNYPNLRQQLTFNEKQSMNSIQKRLPFYDKLELINFIPYSQEFGFKDICLNLFYIEIFGEIYGIERNSDWNEKHFREFISAAYADKEYREFFDCFIEHLGTLEESSVRTATLRFQVAHYLLPYLKLRPNRLFYKENLSFSTNLMLVRKNSSVPQFSKKILAEMQSKNRLMIWI